MPNKPTDEQKEQSPYIGNVTPMNTQLGSSPCFTSRVPLSESVPDPTGGDAPMSSDSLASLFSLKTALSLP